MIYRIYPIQDTFITNRQRIYVPQTASNLGASEILQVFKIAGMSGALGVAGSSSFAHSLVQFDLTSISQLTASGLAPAAGASFRLHMFDARHTGSLPNGYNMEVQALAQPWTEGYGHDIENLSDLGPANWVQSKNGQSWSIPGAYIPNALSLGRYWHRAVTLQNGNILITGGQVSSLSGTAPVNAVDLFSSAAGTSTSANPMSLARQGHTATVLKNGKVLVAGGFGIATTSATSSCEIYDPTTGLWTPTGAMTINRFGHQAVLLTGSGKVLVAAGRDQLGTYVTSSELYDPNNGTWTAGPNMQGQHYLFSINTLKSGLILAAGGRIQTAPQLFSSVSELYDPVANTWTLTSGSMTSNHGEHISIVLQNGKVLVAGGASGSGGLFSTVSEIYDPATSLWTVTTPHLQPRDQAMGAILPSGKVIMAGGVTSASPTITATEMYDPVSGSWSYVGGLVTSIGGAGGYDAGEVNYLPNGNPILFGGGGPVFPVSFIQVFDPNTLNWYSSNPVSVNQQFQTGFEDLDVDVTPLVNAWLTGSVVNNGFLVKISSSQEADSNNYFLKEFFSRQTFLDYQSKMPYLEMRWDDSVKDDRNNFVFDNTGSLYLYNDVRGALVNLPLIGTGSIYLTIQDLSGTQLSVTGSYAGQPGVYSASFAIPTGSYSGSRWFDIWTSTGSYGTRVYMTGTFFPTNNFQSQNIYPGLYTVVMPTLRRQYEQSETPRLSLFVKPRDYNPAVVLTASADANGTVITRGYYRIRNDRTDEDIIPFGTGSYQGGTDYTRLSYDQRGNYFRFYVSSLPKGQVYRITFLFDVDGQIQLVDEGFKFRVV